MVTAELGVGLTALVLCLGVGLQAVAAGIDQVRCVDAAHVAARSAARGDPPGRARALGLGRAPAGSTVTVTVGGREAVVEVAAPPRGLLRELGGPSGRAVASTPVEAASEEAAPGQGASAQAASGEVVPGRSEAPAGAAAGAAARDAPARAVW
ncbi:TadE family type IV pilus minor pilin [Arsenicicoccus sp. oral taxon 190]|uniref:TadE family type IV pilus minor pilin n=1 Tax=Arsenicicoccus sp. oral taxon 190 TaxID=1658671 RepID=UPI000A63505B|nr:TadE family type IV pilus minor pilin [Arsenicicoccus sp. oral taxon 190]